MKPLILIKGLLVAMFSAIIGASIFYIISLGFMYLTRFIPPTNQAEAAPPLWVGLLLVAVLLGMGLSAVFAGYWGYSRYQKSLTHHSSGTPNGAP